MIACLTVQQVAIGGMGLSMLLFPAMIFFKLDALQMTQSDWLMFLRSCFFSKVDPSTLGKKIMKICDVFIQTRCLIFFLTQLGVVLQV